MRRNRRKIRMPILETARLQLRPFAPEDLVPHHQLVGSDPQVTWHGKVLTLEESRAAWERRIHHWEQHGFGMWAVVEKETGSLLGHTWLQMLEDTGEVELGYYFGRPAWGKGIALAKLGFRHIGEARHYGFDVQYWQIAQADFQVTDAFYAVK